MSKQSVLRIALLAPSPAVQSGIASYASAFRLALEALGARVETPLLDTPPKYFASRIQQIDWRSFDHVHAELGGGLLQEFSALQWLAEHVHDVPLSATIHDPERLVWRQGNLAHLSPLAAKAMTVLLDPWTLRQERRLAHRLAQVVTLTQTGADCLRKRMRLIPEQVNVIPHGNQVIPRAELPALTPLKLLYFGYIYRGKGIDDLLIAMAEVFARTPGLKSKLRLTLAGGTEPSTAFSQQGSYFDQLRHQIKNLKLSENIDLALNLKETDIAELIQKHHALVLPYRESKKLSILGQIRGTSGVLAWANACGRGVIASNSRAFPEEVSYGNGILFPQGDTYALSGIIENLALNPDTCIAWAESAVQLGTARAWPAVAEQFMKIFNHPSRA